MGAAVSLALLLCTQAFGWGDEAHEIIAAIADRHLTAQAHRKIKEILGPDVSLSSISNWADTLQNSRPETASWHYIDIPLTATQINPARDCRNGDCVTVAIARSIAVLRDNASKPEAKEEALKFVVHFVADLHQPLHCIDNNDRGGNRIWVHFFGGHRNLHKLWDIGLVEALDRNGENYAARLDDAISESEINLWEKGTPEDWALETHAIGVKIYAGIPRGGIPELGSDYLHSAAPIIDQQLQRAGIRLAYILNQLSE